ncbi:Endoribonuclease L-PSP/chorismate mutase-like protein [Mycena rosella]|uniref:Endoribonuclease L-PSP/chorismate mutase-like protein n=1 Tax=Mycena rosella TaxID=1033263 RepID=A0AAD7CQ82_MYCRO|nr:Endoribonuclease L-PSP/chorismate mutase-like protein [Mycena rosella]
MLRAQALKLLSRSSRPAFARTVPPSIPASFRKMASLSIVSTPHAPAALGPYSQAIKLGDMLFCSGSIPLDPATAEIVAGGIEAQTEQAMKNMQAVLEAGGSELGKVVKTTVFLKSMDDFGVVNGIYARFFGAHKPARSCVEVSRLPKDVLFEIECIASLK